MASIGGIAHGYLTDDWYTVLVMITIPAPNLELERATALVDLDGVHDMWREGGVRMLNEMGRVDGPVPHNHFYLADDVADLHMETYASLRRATPEAIKEKATKDVQEATSTPGFVYDLDEVEGARKGILSFLAADLDVIFCSSPQSWLKTSEAEKRMRISNRYGSDMASAAFIGKIKSQAEGHVLIDDRPEITTILDLDGVSFDIRPTWEHIVFDNPANQESSAPHRMMGWLPAEVAKVIEITKGLHEGYPIEELV